MPQNLLLSFFFHISVILIAIVTLPFVAKKPVDIPPLVSVELIQITDKTNIPFAPKAEKIIEKVKKEKEKLVSEQAPPKKVKKTKTKTVLSPEIKKKKIENQTPEAIPLPEKTVKKVDLGFFGLLDVSGVPLGGLWGCLGGLREASSGLLGASWSPWRPRSPQEFTRTPPNPPKDLPKGRKTGPVHPFLVFREVPK